MYSKSNTLFIGIGYRARSGKDYLAQQLMKACYNADLCAKVYNLANPLKSWCRVQGLMTKKDSTLLQQVGSIYREKDENIWIRCTNEMIEEEKPQIAIIPDVRYINEFNWLRSKRSNQVGDTSLLIHTIRLNKDGTQYIDPSRDPYHRSECELDTLPEGAWDATVTAHSGDTKTLDEFARSIISNLDVEIISNDEIRISVDYV